jgi:opacity protein-like surface antigen
MLLHQYKEGYTMLKKVCLGCMIFIGGMTAASASDPSFYVGPTLLLKTTTLHSSSSREVSPKLTVGYGGVFSQGIYFAGELFLLTSSLQINSKKDTSAVNIKSSFSYGLSVLPGLAINEATTIYTRFGLVKTRFSSLNQSSTGFQAGVGLQTTLSAAWDLRAEYVYTAYRSISGAGAPRSDWAGVGGVYKFA